MLNRSFELFQLDLNLLPMFGALHMSKEANNIDACTFTYEQSLILQRVRKRNTVLFDQFSKLLELEYAVSDNVYMDFLYDAIFVNMNSIKDEEEICVSYCPDISSGECELLEINGAKLKEYLYFKGFSITGVPDRNTETKLRPFHKEQQCSTETVTYRVFVASASMARKGLVLFVNELHYKDLMERLSLGFFSYDKTSKRLCMPTDPSLSIHFNHRFKVSAAKFFAYLGLTLSDGISLEEQKNVWTETYANDPTVANAPPKIELNENTVFVADDMEIGARSYYEALGSYAWVIEGEPSTTASGENTEDKSKVFTAKLRKTAEITQSINAFDGIGFCDNDTFDELERLLLCKTTVDEIHRYSALIIRLPWLKGVLVRCDFKEFFKEKAGWTDIPENKEITDVFGVGRDLSKIRIIVGKSMLKGFKYLINLHNETGVNLPDPWKHYWEKITEYGFSLLITGRNSPEHTTERLNYQFLSTMGLSDELMDDLCKETVDCLIKCMEEPSLQEEEPEETEESNTETDVPFEPEEDNSDENGQTLVSIVTQSEATKLPEGINASFSAALQQADETEKQELRATRYIKSAGQTEVRSGLLDAMTGRISVSGDFRFVAPDLVAMLYFLYDKYVAQKENVEFNSKLNSTFTDAKGHGYYYAPGELDLWRTPVRNSETGVIKGWVRQELAVLRNPHYAVGETAVVYPLPEDMRNEYETYFGDLTSVIMLPATCVATIGGADYDGDRCLCIADSRVIQGIKETIEKNKAHLRFMVEHRDQYILQLEKVAVLLSENTEANSASVLQQTAPAQHHGQWLELSANLKTWIGDANFIPHVPAEEIKFRQHCCPPLIFGDSGSHSMDFKCTSTEIEEALYRSFVLTTKQRIGILSLQALRYAGKAYRVGKYTETSQQLWTGEEFDHLHSWLWHWRLVSLALENGAEIDMAKTGVQCEAAPFRKSCKISGKDLPETLQQLYLLEHDSASMLGTFRKLELGSNLRQKQGGAFAKALLERMLLWENKMGDNLFARSESLLNKPHNTVELLPYKMYKAMLCHIKQQQLETLAQVKKADLLLSFPKIEGTPLQDLILKNLNISVRYPIAEKLTNAEETNGFSATNKITMENLVWAEDEDRQQTVGAFLQHYMKKDRIDEAQLANMSEVTEEEQGIYFLKEVLKFLYFSEQAVIGNDTGSCFTPAALAKKLREIWLDPKDSNAMNLLAYLCHYRGEIYDPLKRRKKAIMDDHLLLAVAGEDFKTKYSQGEPKEVVLDGTKCAAADAVMREYAESKMKRANQIARTEEMKQRYLYCLRNLQRRYALSGALHTIAKYGDYEKTPISQMGIPKTQLGKIFADMQKFGANKDERKPLEETSETEGNALMADWEGEI